MGLDTALSDERSTFRIQNRNPIFGNLLYSWDNLQHSWNDWVLNYDRTRQQNFLSRLEIGIENWSDMVFALIFLLLGVTLLYWVIGWYRERPPRPPAYEMLFRRLLKKLAKQGFTKGASEDTRSFLNRLPSAELPQREQIARVIDLYNHIKYGRRGESTRALASLRSMINAIH